MLRPYNSAYMPSYSKVIGKINYRSERNRTPNLWSQTTRVTTTLHPEGPPDRPAVVMDIFVLVHPLCEAAETPVVGVVLFDLTAPVETMADMIDVVHLAV